MIQIYSPSNTNFEMNGDMVLLPETCEVEAELTGTWVLNMTHPLDEDGRWKSVVEESVISVPTFMGENQLYRISEVDKSDTEVTAKAYPIFFDSANEVFLTDMRPTNKSGQEALDEMTNGTKYSGKSDITTGNTAYFVRRNLIDAIGGENEPTFLKVWGGEPLYNNFQVIINERAGGDYGAEVRYGMNMEGINYKVDMTNVVTRIVPVAYNGRMHSAVFIDSPLINKYAKVYTKEIKFETVKLVSDISDSEDTEGIVVCETQEELDAALLEQCNAQFNAGINLPTVTIEVDMIALENTEEYKDFVDLVKVSLGDTVGCYNFNLDITTKARAIKIAWDCIKNSVKSVVLGDYEEGVFDKFSSTISKVESVLNNDGTVMAERVQGIIDGIKAQIKIQSTAAQPVDGRVFIVEELDPESPLYGCMVFGTQGVQISKKRTEDGRAWDFSTAMTASGVVADAIISGLLSDKTGKNYWNLDTGEFKITNGAIDIEGVAENNFPIRFSGSLGREIKIGPYNVLMQSESDDMFAMISNGSISTGTRDGNSYLAKASLSYGGNVTSKAAYDNVVSETPNVVVWSNGLFRRSSSSSERYKTDITEKISTELNPEHLYDVPIKMFKYKEGYLFEGDSKNGKDVIGFIVEDLEQYYPSAVQYVDGKPEMWNANILLPAMMKLIQEQNKRLKALEGRNGN